MLILAVNTATPALGAALWRDGQLAGEILLQGSRPHAETLLPLVQDLLRQDGLALAAVDAFACAVGPGSYTGIRIGVSAIKAMAYATGKPVVGISTLQALAWPYSGGGAQIACPVIDARNLRIYASAIRSSRCLVPEGNWLAGDFLDQLEKAESGECLLIGSLPEQTQAVFESRNRHGFSKLELRQAPAAMSQPRAAAIAELAERQLLEGHFLSAADLVPNYLSPSQAERRLDQENA